MRRPISLLTPFSIVVLYVFVSNSSNSAAEPRRPESERPKVAVAPKVLLPQPGDENTVYRNVDEKGYRVKLDLGPQVLSVSIPKDESTRAPEDFRPGDTVVVTADATSIGAGKTTAATVFKDQVLGITKVRDTWLATSVIIGGQKKSGWIAASDVELLKEEPELHTAPPASYNDEFVSASLLAQKAKQFDDGLYAAVELAAQNGTGSFAGKTELLSALAAALKQWDANKLNGVGDVVLAADQLGGRKLDLPPSAAKLVDQRTGAFLANELKSKPIAFYTWSPELRAIFQQDRMLQSDLNPGPSLLELAQLVQTNDASWKTYTEYLDLISKLTNPFPPERGDLRTVLRAGEQSLASTPISFFPPSRSHETELVKRLFSNSSIPDDFNLANELIAQVKSGKIKLAPTENSGWYDYQTWALEPLLLPEQMPEASRLNFDKEYLAHLVELFKGIQALTRETHIKQLEIPKVASAARPDREPIVIFVSPQLSSEPLATHYFRRARSYRFVNQVLVDTFGNEALTKMHRLTSDGPVVENLRDELKAMEQLFYGAHVAVSRQLGMRESELAAGDAPIDPAASSDQFLNWTANTKLDADLGKDTRMMVPVFYDLERQKTKVWAFLGWSARRSIVDFATEPKVVEVSQLAKDGTTKPVDENEVEIDVRFGSNWIDLATPITAEIYVDRILSRDEFRLHCDTYWTPAAILANLK